MFAKTAILTLAIAGLQVKAQQQFSVSLYNDSNCAPDDNDLGAQSMSWIVFTEQDDQGNTFAGCSDTHLGLAGWSDGEDADNSKHDVWVDTSAFGDGCSMIFYNFYGSPEQFDNNACRQKYRQVQKDQTECGDLTLTSHFGWTYCCGNLCNEDVSQWGTKSKKRESSPTKQVEKGERELSQLEDIANIKRSPIFGKRADQCTVVPDDIDDPNHAYTTYGPQVKIGPESHCEPEQTTCGQDFTFTTGMEISDGEHWSTSTEVGWTEYVLFSASIENGYEHTETSSESFSTTMHLAPENGHSAYPTFSPLYKCIRAHLEGDCSGNKLSAIGDVVCQNVLLTVDGKNNVPDGNFQMVTTD